ncbi:tetraspanin-9 [Brienomyrus brachyistius]|uniref:tetraspanin-9 n=1 Tax=Brienomyrus brachyistius TaxID=42636 RepID=UPI0020B2B025|nr:tetraspanin-9 [Brienomyrus brachyistius]XP_048847283.1 tetraspanin-9 [Brienomyrus brachyistius]XP_048847284.1 tetraspanin-9 [Brienomyrus brachyistius]XP_048847285.1 tetraspanin-9 [Brienomyrus brachyistius]XP_048847286.1 tetraspanin-9 [Brienomyrus brachyistius]
MAIPGHCFCFVKYLMFIFNLIFWLGGCGLFGVGVWLSFTQAEFFSLPVSFPSLTAANLLLVAGGVTMVTGFLGCLGALKEQRCLLMTFFIILLLVVITEIILVLILHIFREQLDEKAQKELKDGMKTYNTDEQLKMAWDKMQYMLKCCGVNSSNDWQNITSNSTPDSCCSAGPCWTEGCYQKARDWLFKNNTSILVFGICISVIQVLALGFSLVMYCQILRVEKYMY